MNNPLRSTDRTTSTLAAFGLSGARVIREFQTPLGRPKALIALDSGPEVFVGSLAAEWPSADVLNWYLPRINELGGWLPILADDVQIGCYVRALDGSYVVRDDRYHRFVRSAFDGQPAVPGDDVMLLARATALFHRAAAHAIRAHPVPPERRTSVAGMLTHFVVPMLRECTIVDTERLVPEVLERMRVVVRERRATAIHALPALLTHGDLQAKNVLVRTDPQGKRRLAIIDIEQARVQSRLFDLYFLFMGDDSGVSLGQYGLFGEAMHQYQADAGPLSDEETRLLPDVLQIRASIIAAWASQGYPESAGEYRAFLERSFTTALRCFDTVRADRALITRAVVATSGIVDPA